MLLENDYFGSTDLKTEFTRNKRKYLLNLL